MHHYLDCSAEGCTKPGPNPKRRSQQAGTPLGALSVGDFRYACDLHLIFVLTAVMASALPAMVSSSRVSCPFKNGTAAGFAPCDIQSAIYLMRVVLFLALGVKSSSQIYHSSRDEQEKVHLPLHARTSVECNGQRPRGGLRC